MKLQKNLQKNGITVYFTDATINELTYIAYDPTMGARPVKRVIDKYILNDLTNDFLANHLTKEYPITIDSIKIVEDQSTFLFLNPKT